MFCFVYLEYIFFVFISGTIDFYGAKIIEQDLYSSNEQLRDATIYLRTNDSDTRGPQFYKLVDPYRLLVRNGNYKYFYVSREDIQFQKDPLMNGMILSVKLNDISLNKANFTYLTRGIWWAPRYEVNIINEQCKNLREF